MVTVSVITMSPVYRAGITALLREGEGYEIQILEPEDPRDDLSSRVFIVFDDEFENFQAQLIGKKMVLVVNRAEKRSQIPVDHKNGWGLLPYGASAADLIAVVVAVSRGMAVLPPGELRHLLVSDNIGVTKEVGATIDNLTDREMDIMQLLGQGQQNKQIALVLGISENTVKFHVASIFSKLGVSNRTEAVRAGNIHGLISL